MAKVEINESNNKHCRCPKCPVQRNSTCIVESSGPKKLYCAAGKTNCEDFDTGRQCRCPICLVWYKNNLRSTYYCQNGSADEIE